MSNTTIRRQTVLYVAWPIILSNLSTPLLGLVDTAVIGNLGDPALIGAIAIGAMVFSFLYWGFGFLRMGTTGLVAQAKGAKDVNEVKATFFRAAVLGTGIGFLLLTVQHPVSQLAFKVIDGSEAVESAALTYFQIRIWASPFTMVYLAVLGYLLGQQKSGAILGTQLLLNGMNIILDFVFVVGFGWGVAGIAYATLISEAIATSVGLYLVLRHIRSEYGSLGLPLDQLMDSGAIATMFSVNRDIMIRTLCLIFGFAWFTNQGAISGDVLLATNAILMQFVSFSAFFLDGYALAGESLIGQAVGEKNKKLLKDTLYYITELGLVTSLVISAGFYLAGPYVIDVLTTAESVREMARIYLVWAVIAPVVSFWCYLLDGVFIGATRTSEMRNAMIVSLAVYLTAWYYLAEQFDNHGLWLSLHVYFIARAVSLAAYLGRVFQQTEPARLQ